MHLYFSFLLVVLHVVVQFQCVETTITFAPSGGERESAHLHVSGTSRLASQSAQFEPSTATELSTKQSDLHDGEICWSKWDAWSVSTSNCQSTTFTLENLSGETVTTTVFETFKLCDGHPRAHVTAGDKTSLTTLSNFPIFTGSTFGTTTTVQTIIIPPSAIPLSTITTIPTTNDPILDSKCITTPPAPTCSIDSGICSELFSLWTEENFTRNRPPCTFAFPSRTAHGCQDCALFVPSVQLIYFPVTMTGNFCGDYETVTPTATQNRENPSIAIVSGTTFTSGFAYLSYAGVTVDGCGPTKGPGILALPSSSISSLRGAAPAQAVAGDIHYSFNFADLAPNPVPWVAWISQATCVGKETQPQCATITQAAYRPGIVYPHEFFEMEPEWKSCSSGVFGIVDPPIALKARQTIAGPTGAGGGPITSEPAVTRPSKSHELPTSTRVEHTQDPKKDPSQTTSDTTTKDPYKPSHTKTVTATYTTWVTGITIQPITRSYLPEITSIGGTGNVAATPSSGSSSQSASRLATNSATSMAISSHFYIAIINIIFHLLRVLPG